MSGGLTLTAAQPRVSTASMLTSTVKALALVTQVGEEEVEEEEKHQEEVGHQATEEEE